MTAGWVEVSVLRANGIATLCFKLFYLQKLCMAVTQSMAVRCALVHWQPPRVAIGARQLAPLSGCPFLHL